MLRLSAASGLVLATQKLDGITGRGTMADTCRIVALGGLGEVGKNMTVYEYNGAIVVVDAGLAFPRDEHLGVDLVLPDFSYLRERASSIRAVILTTATRITWARSRT